MSRRGCSCFVSHCINKFKDMHFPELNMFCAFQIADGIILKKQLRGGGIDERRGSNLEVAKKSKSVCCFHNAP